MTAARHDLAAPRVVAFGALWNITGRVGPLIVAVLATPYLIADLGIARWGIFTIALSLIGMFGIFDFGVGRALTRLIADRLAAGEEAAAATPVVTGIVLLAGLGAIGAGVMAGFVRVYAAGLPDLSPALRHEVLLALYVLCASAPLVILNSALWGVLSAYQRFAAANLVNVPIMAAYYLGPLVILRFFDSLVAVMVVLVSCRVVMTLCYWRICLRAMPSLLRGRLEFAAVLPVLRIGGWMTVSNITWPLLLYLDRFVIAAMLSAAATAYYATPFDLILRFSIIPVAVMQSGFPAMAASYRRAPQQAARLFRLGSLAIAAIVFPAALIVVGLAEPMLHLWLGADFAARAAGVLRLLGLGVLFMCLDTVPLGLLDGIGRPDGNAKLSLASLIVYVPVLFGSISLFGIEGAALAWTIRVVASYFTRLALCVRLFAPVRGEVRRLLPVLGVALVALATPLLAVSPKMLAATLAAGVVAFGAVTIVSLTEGERAWIGRRVAQGGQRFR